MKIQYASDLHLEFNENSRYLNENPLVPTGDILVLAGDIGYLNNANYRTHSFWDWASDRYKQVLIVPGNHEFYNGYDIDELSNGKTGEIRPNIHWYYNQSVQIGHVQFLFTPLWAYVLPGRDYWARLIISDFKRIVCNGQFLSIEQFNEEHRKCVDFLREQTACTPAPGCKRIIITHHLPTFQGQPNEYSILKNIFTSEEELVRASLASFWIYGHTHRNTPPVRIGETTLICNQLGYLFKSEHHSFRNDACIEL